MRILRTLAIAGALAALAPAAAQAQTVADGFSNSWFWGAKAGIMTFWTKDVSHAPAPLLGAEWMITRQRAALYLSVDQSFFEETTVYPAYASTGAYVGDARARFENMRRVTGQIFVFPKRFGALRPYGGLGFALNFIERAADDGNAPAGSDTEMSLEDIQSRGSLIATAGLQMQLSRLAVFGQGSWMPAQSRFLLNNNETYFVEAGVRVNLAPAVER